MSRGPLITRVAGTCRAAAADRAVPFVLVLAAALVVTLAACGPREKSIPSDPAARTEFMNAAAAKLSPFDRDLLSRFLARFDAQTAAGVSPATVSVTRALELERSYEAQVADAQRSYQKLLQAANMDLAIDVRDATIVKNDKAQPVGGGALRYVINVNNRGQRTIEQFALRVEIRDASGKYQAAVPNLELSGAIRPGDSGRSVQTLPLDAQRHQYILDGKPVKIAAYPIRIAYAGGESIEPGRELKTMESLQRARIE